MRPYFDRTRVQEKSRRHLQNAIALSVIESVPEYRPPDLAGSDAIS
jgi:hypothetical protein